MKKSEIKRNQQSREVITYNKVINNTRVQCNTSRRGGVLRLLLVFLLSFYLFFSHLPFPKCGVCTKLTSGRRHTGGYRKKYWGILMVSPQSAAAAAGPKKNPTDTCTVPVSFLKKKTSEAHTIYIRET